MGDATVTPRAARDVDVVIVGAGLSGLQAATNIQAAGLTFLVLEAKDRVGGKTLSVPTGIGSGVVDVGAAWINDTTQRRMYALSQKFGIDVIKQRATGKDILQREDGSINLVPYGDLNVSYRKDFFSQTRDPRPLGCSWRPNFLLPRLSTILYSRESRPMKLAAHH